jgi:hypothetical protein
MNFAAFAVPSGLCVAAFIQPFLYRKERKEPQGSPVALFLLFFFYLLLKFPIATRVPLMVSIEDKKRKKDERGKKIEGYELTLFLLFFFYLLLKFP